MGNVSISSSRNINGDEDSGWLFNVLDFCSSKTRSDCVLLTKRYYTILTSDPSFRWRLKRLHIEHGVYFPSELPRDHTWRSLFLDLNRKRYVWDADVCIADEGCKYNISVYARLKPRSADCNDFRNNRKIILPLHQRLALIRIDNRLETSKDALRVLKERGGWFKERWDEIESPKAGDDAAKELELTPGIKMIDSKNARVVVLDSTKGLREFNFDGVLKDDLKQVDVYNFSTRGLVCDVINGVNATCLVYGQTGSGKTFTMFGEPESQGSSSGLNGIVPRACSELIEAARYRRHELNLTIQCTISVSFVEIYGNDILDLLQQGRRCGQSKVSAQKCVLDGNAEVEVESVDDVMRLLSLGEAQKRKASTAMNSRSSRAHSIFIVSLKQKCVDNGKSINSKLFLADLGGCEQTKKSLLVAGQSKHVDALKVALEEALKGSSKNDLTNMADSPSRQYSAGFVKSDRMREAVYINLGLLSLKSCVEALSQGGSQHIPYASSKLTQLLASGLGGNSKTTVIVCASQESAHTSETTNAFKFGQACRQVSMTVRTQADMLGDLMKELDLDIAICERRISSNEQWFIQEEKRTDSLAEEGTLEALGLGGLEVRKTTVIAGAEDDRKLLHGLLLKKAQLSGSTRFGAGGHVGFGNAYEYGLGSKFCEVLDREKVNYRFSDNAREEFIPKAVRLCQEESKSKYKVGVAYMGLSV
jgi:hypothetical protein